MMKLTRVATLGTLAMLLGLSGCVVGGGGHGYGDDRDDHRAADQHHDDQAADQQRSDDHRCDGQRPEDCSR